MTDERPDKVYEYWLEASQKLNYFVTGVCLALISYLAGGLKPAPFGFNSAGLNLLSVLCVLMAAVSGFRQIESTVTFLGAMHQRLRHQQDAGTLTGAAVEGRPLLNRRTGDVLTPYSAVVEANLLKTKANLAQESEGEWVRSAYRWYKWRNRFLFLGLLGLIASKVLAGYGR